MQKKQYTLRDFRLTRILAIVFTMLYFGTCSIAILSQNFILLEVVNIVIGLLYYFLPIVVILCWFMCIERYVYLGVRTGAIQDEKGIRKLCNSNVALIATCGICLFCSALAIVYFVSSFGKYLSELSGYFILIILVTVFWLIYMNFSIRRIRKIDTEGVVEKKKEIIHRIFLVIFLLASIVCIFYAVKEADSFVFLKSVLR